MAKVLICIPSRDFDPTETAVPWKTLSGLRHEVFFATPDGKPGQVDPRLMTGKGFGIFSPFLRAHSSVIDLYRKMEQNLRFQKPLAYAEIDPKNFEAIVLPGGHAAGMKTFLESEILSTKILEFYDQRKPIGAICHGVLALARTKLVTGKSILLGRKVTALPWWMEMSAWSMTCLWLGDYYRTYKTPVQTEVTEALGEDGKFLSGPFHNLKDSPEKLELGFTVKDGLFLTARWPGDAHRFADEFGKMLSP